MLRIALELLYSQNEARMYGCYRTCERQLRNNELLTYMSKEQSSILFCFIFNKQEIHARNT